MHSPITMSDHSAALASIALELKNLEHENITVIVNSRCAKLDFTWLVHKTVEKTWYSKILMYCF